MDLLVGEQHVQTLTTEGEKLPSRDADERQTFDVEMLLCGAFASVQTLGR